MYNCTYNKNSSDLEKPCKAIILGSSTIKLKWCDTKNFVTTLLQRKTTSFQWINHDPVLICSLIFLTSFKPFRISQNVCKRKLTLIPIDTFCFLNINHLNPFCRSHPSKTSRAPSFVQYLKPPQQKHYNKPTPPEHCWRYLRRVVASIVSD